MARRLRGMFAVALWDHRTGLLHLVRDHIGKKPLFFVRVGGAFYFASEYKAFLQVPGFAPKLDRESLHYLLNLRWIPGSRSLMAGVQSVLPGETVTVSEDQLLRESYWQPRVPPALKCSEKEHEENILHLLRRAVQRRLVADVPVGLFLSGGIDSSALLALMAEETDQPVQTFCLGFGNDNDETRDAAETAAHFGAAHRNYIVDTEPLRFYRHSVWHSEIPKVNAIQVFLLSARARQQVKVVLSGLGGDELFGGYDNYLFIKYGSWFTDLPLLGLGNWLRGMLFQMARGGQTLSLDYMRRGAQLACCLGRRDAFYGILRNVWDDDRDMYEYVYPSAIAREQHSYSTLRQLQHCFEDLGTNFLNQAMACELREKLVGDQILVEDRNMMAHGLEGRAPFLDVDLIEYALAIPAQLKIHGLRGRKYILKRALRHIVPEFVFNRPKRGFAFDPVQQFQRDLKPVAESILNRQRVEELGIFRYSYIRSVLDHAPAESLHWHYWLLWTMVGVSIWHELFVEGKAVQTDVRLGQELASSLSEL